MSGTPAVFGDIGPGQLYFDTAAFSAPDQNTWGNVTRNGSIRGPGFWNIDLSLVKRMHFGGRVVAELRADAINAFNHPIFANPNGAFGSATFGQVTGTPGPGLHPAPRPLRRAADLLARPPRAGSARRKSARPAQGGPGGAAEERPPDAVSPFRCSLFVGSRGVDSPSGIVEGGASTLGLWLLRGILAGTRPRLLSLI